MLDETDLDTADPADHSLSHGPVGPATGLNDPRLQLIERITSSEPFQKSSKLPHLLRYLAQHSLASDRAGLTEQAIGRHVFSKAKDFNPAEDSSVRVYIRQLRLRLHEFYQSAGQEELFVVEIPKGGYALTFQSRSKTRPAVPPPPDTSEITAPTPVPGRKSSSLTVLLPWLLFALATAAAFAGWFRPPRTVPVLPVPWPLSSVIHPDCITTVVLADASYSLRMLTPGDFTLDDYIHHERLARLVAERADSRDAPLIHYMEFAQITSIADAHAAAILVGLSGSSWTNLTFRSAKDLSIATLGDGDFIFLGAKTSNPWVELYEGRLNFPIHDGPGNDRYVQNRAPRPGEQTVYRVTGQTGSSGEDYATISLIANTGGHGSLLLIQGVRLEGTEAAIRFLADGEHRTELAERLKAANNGALPRHFEVLLHAHSVAGSAVSIDCAAVRVLAD